MGPRSVVWVAMSDAGIGSKNTKRSARVQAAWERLGESLFYVPSLFMIGAVIAAQVLVFIDGTLDTENWPTFLTTTVDSSRVLLSVIAGGTITAASVVFSLTLVAVQLASTQFSPRTLGTFLGDRVQQMIIGLVLGTFVYCLLVLRVVRAPIEEGGSPFIPGVSVIVAVILGVASMVAVIASINRTAQSLRVSSIAQKVTDATIEAIKNEFGEDDLGGSSVQGVKTIMTTDRVQSLGAAAFESRESGWIQDIDVESMVCVVPDGGELGVSVAVGNYVVRGQTVVSISPRPEDSENADRAIADAIVIGPHRSRHGDVAFGITQLVDIAVKALSPGVNDPNTAEEIVVRLGEVLVELAIVDLPPRVVMVDGRSVRRNADPTHEDYINLAVEPIRRFARNDPRVLASLLRMLSVSKEVAQSRRPDASTSGFEVEIGLITASVHVMAVEADRQFVLRTAQQLCIPLAD